MADELSESFLNAFTTFLRAHPLWTFFLLFGRGLVHMAQMFTEAYESRQMKEQSHNSYFFVCLSNSLQQLLH